ncbi:hypothetical protein KPNJ1_01098 [Klebsiella pneumoniae 30660/NJST258_1]|uniref:Uncharacterized protein n=1 Tax=Klebsiella pneumoniae 30684/NJST258_2 TaxID=1420013 RepID=W8UD91_KLEPN|nr:hypothetical protein KPNJ2_01129 [Klebsiella pneumoniae 30684/NJST258_2]AHM83504.1 hypothetical protein KPNJ1_01098 [Klebsiella pneumoniae 30660/NJST258_1]
MYLSGPIITEKISKKTVIKRISCYAIVFIH